MNRNVKRAIRFLPLLVVVLLAGAMPASASIEQSDALIKGGAADASYLGDGIYNDDGADQTKSRRLRAGESDSFRFAVQNDYFGTQYFTILGEGNTPNFSVRYINAGVDITDEVTSGNFESECLDNNEMDSFRVVVKAEKNAPAGASNLTLIDVVSVGFCGKQPTAPVVLGEQCFACDTVGVKVTVRSRAGDANGQAPR